MARIEGESLGARLAREPRPPVAVVRRVLAEVADALAYAHARGVVHRDIKPDNILLDRESGRPMVTDFGIAGGPLINPGAADEGGNRLTEIGTVLGTPAYMSPEQALGEREVDGRSDIYSLGVVGYQMLAGAPPFAATNTPAMLMKHLSERPRPLGDLRPEVPPRLAAAVERALAKRPDDRWPDAATLRDALRGDAYLAYDAPPARVPGAPDDGRNGREDHAPREAVLVPQQQPDQRLGPAAGVPAGHPGNGARPTPPAPGPPAAAPGPWTPAAAADWKAARRAYQAQRQIAPAQWSPQWRPPEPRAPEVRPPAPLPPRDALGGSRPVEDRIRTFRRSLGGYGAVVAGLGAINALTTPWFPWFLFPTVGMGIPILIQLGSLWADRVRLAQIFGHDDLADSVAAIGKLAPADVLRGPHGAVVQAAFADQRTIIETVAKLQASDKSLLPDVSPTTQALVERVAALAAALTRLDADLTPGMLESIDARLAAARRDGAAGPDQERKLALLERQRATVADLVERRGRLAHQLESASLMIGNIKLDLLKLRSAGVGAAIGEVTHATQEARALSREIGYVLEAAKEVRDL
jgi:serine/threonine-protein kinase